MLIFSSILIILGFVLLGNFREFLPFLLSTMVLGLGMGLFKPALQGIVANTIPTNTSSNLSPLG
jgi:dipeptide/tripeptide permease